MASNYSNKNIERQVLRNAGYRRASRLPYENSEDGVILGAIYSTEDVSTTQSEKQLSVNLEDGSYINADKENQTLTVAFSKMKLIGNIEHEGTFTNTAGIKSNADITDKTSSMQAMRDVYNSHTHTGNQGKATSAPNKTM